MSEIARFTVSVEGDLLERFDRFCAEQKYATRSEAVRQLIHQRLTRQAWKEDDQEVAGTLTLVYDHHRAQLRDRLLEVSHDHTDLIVSVLHTHLTHHVCLEVIVLRGPAGELRDLAMKLGGLKGIHTSELVMATADENIEPE